MSLQVDKSRKIPGTTVFDGRESRKGYRINKFAMSFCRSENREAFKSDEEAYMERWGLSEQEIMKIGTCTGQGLYHIGAQLRGETFEQFMDTRNARGAR